jgi:Transposase DNA-binding
MKEHGPDVWARQEFGAASIDDERWRRRLVQMAKRAAVRPAGRVTEAFANPAERQGAYGLLESDEVSTASVGSAMFAACARRCCDEDFVYCPIDGTSVTLSDGERSKDFGPIGSRAQGARGLKVMNAMVLSAAGVPLGISSQQWWTRTEHKRDQHRDKLGPEEKETKHWLAAMTQTRELMAKYAPETRCWFQLDREGDAWPLLRQAGLDEHWFTIRASRNRWVLLPDGEKTYLQPLLAAQPVKTTYQLEVRAAAKRQARTAVMEVRACCVTVSVRDKRTGKRSPLTINVVQARERATTPVGEKPLDWTLLTNRSIENTKDLTAVIYGYAMRWRIEELHRTWKSGACGVEQTQLRSAQAVIKWATILIAVALRIERIKRLSRAEPDRPASDEFSATEIKAVILLRFDKSKAPNLAPGEQPTMAQLTLWIAELGGYTGRTSSGGPPGTITIGRGLATVRAVAKALKALAQ